METLETIAKIPYSTSWSNDLGQLRLAKILDLTYIVFAPENAEFEDNFFIKTGDFELEGRQFNARATINFSEDGNCFFNIPEKLIPLTEGC